MIEKLNGILKIMGVAWSIVAFVAIGGFFLGGFWSDWKTVRDRVLNEDWSPVSQEGTSGVLPQYFLNTGLGPGHDTNVGIIESRKLRFTKKSDSSVMRFGYTDNFRARVDVDPQKRTRHGDAGCRWEIRVDQDSCKTPLVYDIHEEKDDNNSHRSQHLVGYCEDIKAGTHIASIWVSPVPQGELGDFTNSDCSTGWKESRWVLEAWEVEAATVE